MRWVVRALGALSVLVVIGIGLVMMIPTQQIAQMAADRFESLTGRVLTIEGDVSPRFWPVLGVSTGPVSIANADWSDADAPMLKAQSLMIEINASALLGGDVKILGLTAERPELVLERARDGRENWVFGGGGTGGEISTETPGVGRSYTLEKGLIQGGTLRFIDWGAGIDTTLDDLDLELAIPDYTGPFTVNGTGIVQGQRLALTVEGGAFAAFTEGRVVPLTLSAAVGGASFGFEGRAGWQPMAAEGRVTADLSDLTAIGALSGAGKIDLPQGFGAEKLVVSGQFTLDQDLRAYLRQARIEADSNLLAGDLDLVTGGDRPKISGNLRAAGLDFSGISGGEGGGEGGGQSGGMQAEGWPRDRNDASALGVMDASLTLVSDAIDLGAVKLGASRLVLNLERARAVFDIREMAAYGGAVKGEFVVNGRGGLSLGGSLSLANLQVQPLLQDLAGWDRLSTTGNLTLSFLAVGNTMDELMRSLKGNGNLAFGKGELIGLDIAGMLRTLDAGFVGDGQKTIFDGIAGSFTMEGGNLINNDLRLMAPYLTAEGAGRIGIGARDLDYRILPTAFPGEDGTGGVKVPLRITGPWANPSYRLDLESIAREKMEAEARAAEERAKAALQERLGIEAAENERLEDAAKRRAREALEKEAGRLFEGLLGGN